MARINSDMKKLIPTLLLFRCLSIGVKVILFFLIKYTQGRRTIAICLPLLFDSLLFTLSNPICLMFDVLSFRCPLYIHYIVTLMATIQLSPMILYRFRLLLYVLITSNYNLLIIMVLFAATENLLYYTLNKVDLNPVDSHVHQITCIFNFHYLWIAEDDNDIQLITKRLHSYCKMQSTHTPTNKSTNAVAAIDAVAAPIDAVAAPLDAIDFLVDKSVANKVREKARALWKKSVVLSTFLTLLIALMQYLEFATIGRVMNYIYRETNENVIWCYIASYSIGILISSILAQYIDRPLGVLVYGCGSVLILTIRSVLITPLPRGTNGEALIAVSLSMCGILYTLALIALFKLYYANLRIYVHPQNLRSTCEKFIIFYGGYLLYSINNLYEVFNLQAFNPWFVIILGILVYFILLYIYKSKLYSLTDMIFRSTEINIMHFDTNTNV